MLCVQGKYAFEMAANGRNVTEISEMMGSLLILRMASPYVNSANMSESFDKWRKSDPDKSTEGSNGIWHLLGQLGKRAR
jgi:hypothetical protein